MTKGTRPSAGGNELGSRRYQRYCAAFDWVEGCIDKGYYLEAIAILDSLLLDRLSSRLGHVSGEPVGSRSSTGGVCKALLGDDPNGGSEREVEFREAIRGIWTWVGRRNEAMHATAKILESDSSLDNFESILKAHCRDAIDGIQHLRTFDALDTASRARAHAQPPASFPDAFFPERRRCRFHVASQPER